MSINPDLLKKRGQIGQIPNHSLENSLVEELKAQRNLLLKIYADTRKTRRYIMFGKIISFIYLILIIAPIIFAVIYLPPLLKNVVQPYQELLLNKNNTTQSINLHNFDFKKASQFLKTLNK